MIHTLKIYELLALAKIEEPKARAITDAITRVVEENNVELGKTLMTKEDGHRLELMIEALSLKMAELENRLIKWVFGMLTSQAIVVLGGVYFMISHTK